MASTLKIPGWMAMHFTQRGIEYRYYIELKGAAHWLPVHALFIWPFFKLVYFRGIRCSIHFIAQEGFFWKFLQKFYWCRIFLSKLAFIYLIYYIFRCHLFEAWHHRSRAGSCLECQSSQKGQAGWPFPWHGTANSRYATPVTASFWRHGPRGTQAEASGELCPCLDKPAIYKKWQHTCQWEEWGGEAGRKKMPLNGMDQWCIKHSQGGWSGTKRPFTLSLF